jgi:hypothetical protein
MKNLKVSKIFRKIFSIISENWEYFYYRFYYSRPVAEINFVNKRYLFCGGEDLKKILSNYYELFPDNVHEKIAQADLICQHIFNLLGSGPVRLSPKGKGYQPIDWHTDFKSHYSWNPNTFFRNIRFGHIEGVDIKIPWELSRFQHLNILGQAYALTENKRYADEFGNQIRDWIKNNPVAFGVNWKCTMDVAIRASNWLVAQEYFSRENVFPKDFWQVFYASIYEHGRFIIRHLENRQGFTTNHYLSNLAGLFFIAIYCPFFEESKTWQEFALKELSKEIEKQVYPDGCNFEASTSYHRLALELFFYTELLGNRAGIEFPKHYKDQVRKMFDFSLYCIKPNGKIPQIGDNDSGRFLIFRKRPVLEHKYLLSLAALYYRDPDFKIPSFNYDEEAFWAFGMTGKDFFDALSFRGKPIGSKGFSDAGWYIMHDENNYCFISCGPNGQVGNGGHAHNDKLSFELMLNGEDVVVDPGTYVYTPYPEWRNKFRSTAFHNTMQIDDIEQNDISKDIFEMGQGVECKIHRFEEKDDEIVFEGEVSYLKYDIIHKRKFILSKKELTFEIIDKIRSRLRRKFSIILCLGNHTSKYDFSLKEGTLETTEGFYSSGYGSKEKMVFLRSVIEGYSDFENKITVRIKQGNI